MTKARDLANLIAAGNPLADGAISVAEISDLTASAAELNQLDNTADLPDIRPSLLLDFANSKTLDPRITFTRGSTASCWDGKTTAKAEENLFKYSEQFDNFYWNGLRSVVTTNQTTAPDGTTTADAITQASGETSGGFINPDGTEGYTSGVTYTTSIYAKPNGKNFLRIMTSYANGIQTTWFNLSTGSVGTSSSDHTASMVDAGNGWYRCIVTATADGDGYINFYIAETDAVYDVTDDQTGYYAWGAQLEQRSSATAYTATTDSPIVKYQPVLQTAASGEARFDHDPVTGESKGLLIEEARTNLVTYSGSLSSFFTQQSSLIPSTVVAPDGTLSGNKIQENTTANINHNLGATFSMSASTTHTLSIFAKKAERDYLGLNIYSGTTSYWTWYNLSDGTVGTATNSPTTSMEDVGNGWYRCSITVTTASTGTPNIAVYSAVQNGSLIYDGDGYSGIYVWGAQLEEGSFPTSYIPTSGSTVTRAQDHARMLPASFAEIYNPTESTMFSEFSSISDDTGYGRIWEINSVNSSLNRFALFHAPRSSNKRISMEYRNNNTIQASLSVITDTPVVTNAKVASGWAQSDFASVANGGTVLTSGTGSIYSTIPRDTLGIGGDTSNGSPLTGHIKKLAYYPKRLPNATLQAMTEE